MGFCAMCRNFHYSLLTIAIIASLANLPLAVMAADIQPVESIDTESLPQGESVTFDPTFLYSLGHDSIDLSRFAQSGTALPGTWPTDIFVNGEQVSHENVKFTEQADKSVQPCLSTVLLKKINFDYSQLSPSIKSAIAKKNACYLVKDLVAQAGLKYDPGTQRLDISIPQAMMLNNARGYVSPELWDKGVPALLLGYNANYYTNRSNGKTSNSAYTGINAGLNVGPWYLRHDGSYIWQENYGGHYQTRNNYVQRDIPAISGRVLLGQTSTQGLLFDTLPFRGIELYSDDRMLPQSRRGYAPDIHGTARTNARVTVRQSGRVIYETTVSPGAFVIDDLYPTGYGGNLDVTVTEADGSVQTFSVPYASVTQLLRPGTQRYDIVAGKLNDPSLSIKPTLYQATYQRGLTNILTGYGGIQGGGTDYYAIQGGLAISTPIGAIAADVTTARTHLSTVESGGSSGQSYQLSYSKYLPDTNSNLTLAAYRFSTSGYYDFTTAMQAINEERNGGSARNIWRPKNRFNATLSQGLEDGWGQIYLTGYSQNYWNNNNTDIQYQMGYSNNWKNLNYSVSAGRVRNTDGHMETNWLLNLSLPLGREGSTNAPMLTAAVNHDGNGRTGEQLSLSGTNGNDNQFGYGLNASHYNQGTGNSMALNGAWRAPYTNVTAAYGTGKNYQNASVGLSGTLISWPWGIVSTPYTGDTFAIVEAKGAKGAKVSGYTGVHIDSWGHAAVPYLNPYEFNVITIDPKGLPDDVELENTSDRVAPYSGAVSKIVFKTKQGIPLLILAKRENGEPVTFGANVYDSLGNTVGSVGQAGQIFARVSKERDTLKVKLGDNNVGECTVNYILPALPKNGKTTSVTRFDSVCK